MKKIPVEKAIGHVLCHDMTRIVRDTMKGPQFRKGHIIQEADIPMLLSMGKEHIYVWEKLPDMLHEDEAAEALAKICRNRNMKQGAPKEGRIDLFAACDGLFITDAARLNAINGIDEICIAARHSNSPVKAGDMLAGMRVVPLVVSREKLARAESAAGEDPIMDLLPYTLKTACVITTGSEVAHGRIRDDFTPVVVEKLSAYGISLIRHFLCGDDIEAITDAIKKARKENPDLIICTGGMSVDPDDNTPGAIKRSGAHIITYGTPVLPGSMFLLAYCDNGMPIMGLPGCVMYKKITIFDLVLPRIAAGLTMTRKDFTLMGNGGLCLSCRECTYPRCSFGKGF
jgi:molybdopterin biosynthesis enzyme